MLYVIGCSEVSDRIDRNDIHSDLVALCDGVRVYRPHQSQQQQQQQQPSGEECRGTITV